MIGSSALAANPSLVIDANSGEVLFDEGSTRPWYPASLTKLMTAYVAFTAIKQGRVTLDTPFVMSARAARMPPSKMAFNPGTEVTLDNALKMLMVKSANDIAIMIAEGISGSVEDFAQEMNATAARLGMTNSHFVNPNGLHDPHHVSSARDLAIIAQALYKEFPAYSGLYSIGALQLGTTIIPTHNGLIGRYPGADGMKTGFTCPAGFNVVASAQRNDRRLITVVLGYPNAKLRTLKAASLLDAGFSAPGTGRVVKDLKNVPGDPPNLRADVCGKNRKQYAQEDFGAETHQGTNNENAVPFAANDDQMRAALFNKSERPVFEPVTVFVGRIPGWLGLVAQARPSADPQAKQNINGKGVITRKDTHKLKPKTAKKLKPLMKPERHSVLIPDSHDPKK